MKKAMVYALVVVAVLGLGWSIWYYLTASGDDAGNVNGYPLVCPHCNGFFVIGYNDMPTHARGANGEGLKCDKCGKFGAQPARQCETCKRWYGPQSGGGCPTCNKNAPRQEKAPERGMPGSGA